MAHIFTVQSVLWKLGAKNTDKMISGFKGNSCNFELMVNENSTERTASGLGPPKWVENIFLNF